MATITQTVGSPVSLTFTGLNTLTSGSYVTSSAYTANTTKPLDVIVEVTIATTNTPINNKQVVLFVLESLDGTTFRTGGTSTTDESNARLLGTLPIPSTSTTVVGTFSVAQVLGYCPYAFKVVAKNDLGVTLTTGSARTSEISATSA